MNILFIGDIIGAYGREITRLLIADLKREYAVDLTVANGENSAHGYSITEKIYHAFMAMGIDALTMGNHVWEKKEVVTKIASFENMARPANYPPGVPGKDHLIIDCNGVKVGIVNLLGRVFMPCMDCPFQTADKLIPKVREQAKIIIVDMHAEATSEKCAMGYYLDGQVSAVVGTHTHVVTADERILTGGTAYISDVGMVGARDSVIGMSKEQILKRFTTQLPEKFAPAEEGPGLFNAVLLKIDPASGKALEIKRISRITEPLNISKEDKAAKQD
ncbi:MAG TPA: TIGR00282 family metallophosphoesterase [Candidatus Sulfotelmatobacter sp.]|nr:TIGR00282 family metallophosphoesterase [Candidatus Sulfotelmatobacter sp.]